MMHGFAAAFSRPRLRLLHLAAPLQQKNRNILMIDHLQHGGFGALQRSPPAATSALFSSLRHAHHSNGLLSSGRCIHLLYCTYSVPYLSVAVLRLTVTVVHFFQL
jgi:hypothetical protein